MFQVAALSGLAVGQAPERDQTIPDCVGKVADVFFVLDSSTSIYVDDYRQELQFTRDVISRFDISRDTTRVGALSFSDDFQVNTCVVSCQDSGFDLDRVRNKATTLSAVDERTLPYRTGVTNTDLALRYVRTNVNVRPDITKVIIVITDGVSRLVLGVRRSHCTRSGGGQGCWVLCGVVGAGQYLDENEWRVIASDPDSEFIFNITNFSNLQTLRDSLPRRLCRLPPLIVRTECVVDSEADLLFLAAPNGINDALDIMEDISRNFVNKERLTAQYIMDNCEDNQDVGFQGPDLYCNRFGNVVESGENTYVNLLTRLRNAATALRAGGRDRKQVAVLFVDDQSIQLNRFGILREARNAAQLDGLDIVVIDLGVRQFVNFVLGLTPVQENYVNYVTQGANQAVRRTTERICACEFLQCDLCWVFGVCCAGYVTSRTDIIRLHMWIIVLA
ncbi:hypothetical protein C0Q70_20223 [Pomacea canaliculata]|uniref:VWFA domain-containing protein n=1 Tax=Pomacea canaliculata TaxID=400727 RepID=A0A2T7NF31_POMCA|nr:hypothetical protein C0Q70_20223 [Pomacea canaliculata]